MTIDLPTVSLWHGCLLASIAHAVGIARYPEVAHLHSWDGHVYNVCTTDGVRASVCFGFDSVELPTRLACSCLNPKSDRAVLPSAPAPLFRFFPDIDLPTQQLAEETFQYLLTEHAGSVVPWVTTGMWGDGIALRSVDSSEVFFREGGTALSRQMLPFDAALREWSRDYGLSKQEEELVSILHRRVVAAFPEEVVVSPAEWSVLESHGAEGLDESTRSLSELNIRIEASN